MYVNHAVSIYYVIRSPAYKIINFTPASSRGRETALIPPLYQIGQANNQDAELKVVSMQSE